MRRHNEIPHQHGLRFNYIWQLQLCFSQPDRYLFFRIVCHCGVAVSATSPPVAPSCLQQVNTLMGIHANALLTNTAWKVWRRWLMYDPCVIHCSLCTLIMVIIRITVPVALLSLALSQGSFHLLAHRCTDATLHVTYLLFTRIVYIPIKDPVFQDKCLQNITYMVVVW